MLQPRSFDPVSEPVSTLAALGATDRWLMTLVFVTVGVCELVTGLALRPAGLPGRLLLMVGAVTGFLVAVNPEMPGGVATLQHEVWSGIGLAALVTWPVGACRRGAQVPWSLRPVTSAVVVFVQLALLAWFVLELLTGAGHAGLAERVLGTAQILWPLAVVLSLLRPIPLRVEGEAAS